MSTFGYACSRTEEEHYDENTAADPCTECTEHEVSGDGAARCAAEKLRFDAHAQARGWGCRGAALRKRAAGKRYTSLKISNVNSEMLEHIRF